MPEIWFTSDTHYGHKNILEYEPIARPFKTIEEMNEQLISNYNSIVGDGDTVFHVGDFAFGKHNIAIAERLKGKKKLILGNHDSYPSADYLRYFEKLYGVLFWERCILSHVPVHPNGLGARWFLNVHGHLHSKNVRRVYHVDPYGCALDEYDPNYFNVAVEQHNLTPVNADVIRERMKELKNGYE